MTTPSAISAGEVRLMAVAAVNDELDRALAAIDAPQRPLFWSGLSYRDRLRLKEAEIENDCHRRGIRII